jgi:hypothetical protein
MDGKVPPLFSHLSEAWKHRMTPESVEGVECTYCTIHPLLKTLQSQLAVLTSSGTRFEEIEEPSLEPWANSHYGLRFRDDVINYRSELVGIIYQTITRVYTLALPGHDMKPKYAMMISFCPTKMRCQTIGTPSWSFDIHV